jgi:hypothetical protein
MQQPALHDRKTSLTFGETAVRQSFCLCRSIANVRYWHKADIAIDDRNVC